MQPGTDRRGGSLAASDADFALGGVAAGWRTAGPAVGILLLAVLGIYWDTAAAMVGVWWRSETFTHGFLIVPISGYLIWRRRHALSTIPPAPNLWAGVALVGLAGLWMLGRAAGVMLVQHAAMTAMIPAAVWMVLGTSVVRAITFPLGYLIFAIPAGESLIPPLMDFTAAFSVELLRWTGIPVFWEGRYIALPTGNWEVAEACSGVRYLIASLAVGSLYAYLSYRRWWRRAIFVALAGLVPILANGVRAYGIIMLGHLSDMRLAVGVDHILYGWVFFGLVMLALFWIGRLWQEHDGDQRATDVAHMPKGEHRPQGFYIACLSALAIAGAGPVAALWLDARAAEAHSVTLQWPAGPGGWSGPRQAIEPWNLGFEDAGVRAHKVYAEGEHDIHVYLVHYPRERQGKELIRSRIQVFDQKQWRRIAGSRRRVTIPGNGAADIYETLVRSEHTNRALWHWYVMGGHATASAALAKLWGAWAWLRAQTTGSTLMVMGADYEIHPDEARQRLKTFVQAVPELATARVIRRGESTSVAGDGHFGQGTRLRVPSAVQTE